MTDIKMLTRRPAARKEEPKAEAEAQGGAQGRARAQAGDPEDRDGPQDDGEEARRAQAGDAQDLDPQGSRKLIEQEGGSSGS